MTTRMLHVLESFAPGGMETTFLRLLAAMPRQGVRHEVLAFQDGPLRARFEATTDAVHLTARPADLQRLLGQGWDVVHVLFDRCANRVAPFVLGRTDAAFVYWKGYDLAGMFRVEGGFPWHAETALVQAADAALFTTTPLAAAFEHASDRTLVLGKAADVDALMALPPPDERTPRRVLAVANLHPRKRLGDLVSALSLVRERVPDAELRLVGGGNALEAERLRRQADALGLGDAVTFAGVRAGVSSELAEARVLALPSQREGVPTVLLEAMAAHRPVVATPAGHTTTILDDGREGFIVNVGDVVALSERLTRLLTDLPLARGLGAAGRARARAHGTAAVAARLDGALRHAAHARTASQSYALAS